MAINKVGTKGITDGAISAIDFADNTITSGKLVNSAITNALLSNSSITLSGTSIALGASASFTNKFVQWQSVITGAGSSSTAVAGKGYFINTTSAVHTINLPASASIGDFVAIKDYAGTFATYNLTIGRNGHNIQGVANDSLITTNRASLVLVYVDSTKGWLYWEEHNVTYYGPTYISATGGTVATSGDYKIHSFTGDADFVVSSLGNAVSGPLGNSVSYLVVAGGAGGGNGPGGGGGAGGFREGYNPGSYTASPLATSALPVSATTYPITIGAGGGGKSAGSPGRGTSGSNSIFSTITSAGGGGGGGGLNPGASPGLNGGSGGGGGNNNPAGPGGPGYGPGGTGNTPPVSPSQGNNGGLGDHDALTTAIGGGGGGASAAGTNAPIPSRGGPGGNGATTSINGSPTVFAGGGGGGQHQGDGGAGAAGGTGGGGASGAGNQLPTNNGVNGTANTGGGGGAGSGEGGPGGGGGTGGSGIVIIRYKFQ
jgi:hypothetical protein